MGYNDKISDSISNSEIPTSSVANLFGTNARIYLFDVNVFRGVKKPKRKCLLHYLWPEVIFPKKGNRTTSKITDFRYIRNITYVLASSWLFHCERNASGLLLEAFRVWNLLWPSFEKKANRNKKKRTKNLYIHQVEGNSVRIAHYQELTTNCSLRFQATKGNEKQFWLHLIGRFEES